MTGPDFPAVRRSPLFRLAFLALLVVLLQVPIIAIAMLVRERQTRRDSAVEEVSAKWGRAQALTGPVLVVPYRQHWIETRGGESVTKETIEHAAFLPEALSIGGKLVPEARRRGIFSIPVYALDLEIAGTIARPDPAALGIAPQDFDWDKAEIALGVSDVRAIQERTSLNWQGKTLEFLPGPGTLQGVAAGLHAPVAVARTEKEIPFTFPLRLHGSVGVRFTPAGKQSDVRIASTWPSPSFTGEWLPTHRTVTKDGFTAEWSIPYLGRNVPQAWTSDHDKGSALAAMGFGLDLLETVDSYRMADRSIKYATLFLLLTLIAVWLAEVLAGIAVHPIQSLLLCTALIMFYLLELSLAEHLGFVLAYGIASVAVTAMIGAYGKVALGTWRRALGLAAGVAVLYGYLYVLLVNEDYALLVGSIGLFALLGLVMYVTRRVDWTRLEARGAEVGASRSI